MVSRRVPAQRRSRERVEQMLRAAAELLAEGGVEALTTRSLAERTGIPVATIYRYFANRNAIIAAYLDRDLEEIQESLRSALLEMDTVTFRSAVEAVALAPAITRPTRRAFPSGSAGDSTLSWPAPFGRWTTSSRRRGEPR